ncbi:hypothetical protein TOPH_07738 [Tolypocladium ophioglossoides CBS 100239]|uniref:Rhodopsin domain-containing protein n=1 Tax=Tolypocladium ophioglossoides (strain CBS 100239) TaxID=1163406 RepID=A0A0L0N0H1_TOLOC|nr:hypothetical protein TOPH_07738 [Tolypocladium ophioglossoides CBS 100239]
MDRDFPESEESAYWKRVTIAVPLTFTILATIVYMLRVYATRKISSKVRAEDVLMGCAVVLMWGDTASILLKAFNGVGVPDALLPHYRQVRFKLGSWLVIKFWSSSMICAKLSIILFLRRVIGVRRAVRMALDFMAVAVVIWGLSNFFYTIFFCQPVAYYWDRTIPGGRCVGNHVYMIESKLIASIAVVMDFIILLIPMPTVWNLQIKTKRKIAISSILGVGVVVCIFSLLRAVQFGYFDTANLSTSSNLEGLWTLLENNFTVMCGSMPQLGPLFKKTLSESTTSGKAGQYYRSNDVPRSGGTWGFRPMNDISTSVSGTYDKRGQLSQGEPKERQNSSEIELRGIEVHTTINQEVSRDIESEQSR